VEILSGVGVDPMHKIKTKNYDTTAIEYFKVFRYKIASILDD
jgi:hypothetical protein